MVKVTACWFVDLKSAVIHFQSRLLNDYNVYYVNSCESGNGSFQAFALGCRYKLAFGNLASQPCQLIDQAVEAADDMGILGLRQSAGAWCT